MLKLLPKSHAHKTFKMKIQNLEKNFSTFSPSRPTISAERRGDSTDVRHRIDRTVLRESGVGSGVSDEADSRTPRQRRIRSRVSKPFGRIGEPTSPGLEKNPEN